MRCPGPLNARIGARGLSARHGLGHYAGSFRLNMKNASLKNSSLFHQETVELYQTNRRQPCRALAVLPVRYLPVADSEGLGDALQPHPDVLKLLNQPTPVFLFFVHLTTV